MQEICSSQGEEVSMDKMMNKFDDAIMKDKVNDPVLKKWFAEVKRAQQDRVRGRFARTIPPRKPETKTPKTTPIKTTY